MSEGYIDYQRLLAIRVNARKCGATQDELEGILISEIQCEALRLYNTGLDPLEIRAYIDEMNRALMGDGLPDELVEKIITDTFSTEEESCGRKSTAPGDHLARLAREVLSWGDSFAFNFGIPSLDQVWGGLMPGEIGVLVGAQGSMKTSLALTGAEHFLRENPENTVLFFSLDMTQDELAGRLIMRDLGVNQVEVYGMMKARNRQYLEAEARFAKATKGRLRVLGNEGGRRWTIDGVERQIGIYKPKLVIIDFLTSLKRTGQSDLHAVEEIMPRLQAITQRTKIKTLILSQMGRASKSDQSKGVIGGHSKGGGIVEELCHAEIELFRDQPEDGETDHRIIATVTKTRRGVSGASFDLAYRGETMDFTGNCRRVRRDRDHKSIFQSITGLN